MVEVNDMFCQMLGYEREELLRRIDPKNANVVDFAFKQSLSGPSFMWGVWADAGLKDPSKFNYNDRFTNAQAGSPIASSPFYPINAIYAVDNTCRAALGFKPTGYEPGLCPPITQPASTLNVRKSAPSWSNLSGLTLSGAVRLNVNV